MKDLLSIFTALTLSTGIITPLINQNIYSTDFTNYQTQKNNLLEPTSMLNLQKSINAFHAAENNIKDSDWRSTAEEDAEKKYNDFLNKNTVLSLSELEMNPISETIRETFSDVYTNRTPNKQTFQTQSYSKTITNTSSFSIKLQESFKITAEVNFIFAGTKIEANISSEQTWTNTVSIQETLTAPSQSFTVDPMSIGKATYVIKDGHYQFHGLLRAFIPLDTPFWTSTWWDQKTDSNYSAWYNFDGLIKTFNSAGYGDLLKLTSNKFSIISADNPEHPTIGCINIPVSWQSDGGKINVTLTQESLNF